jgi:hypothetical protein
MYEYDYTIWPDNSTLKFKETCDKIKTQFPNAEEKELLIDVDGSTIQIYKENNKEITVFDDYDVGAVFVKSEIELPMFA